MRVCRHFRVCDDGVCCFGKESRAGKKGCVCVRVRVRERKSAVDEQKKRKEKKKQKSKTVNVLISNNGVLLLLFASRACVSKRKRM